MKKLLLFLSLAASLHAQEISLLTNKATPAAADKFVIYDVAGAAGKTVTLTNLFTSPALSGSETNSGSLNFTGTGGASFIDSITQSSNPASPSGGHIRLFISSGSILSWKNSTANVFTAVSLEGNQTFTGTITLPAPIFSGIVNRGSGANVETPTAMGALVIDVTKGKNTKTIAVDSTFTFSGTPATASTLFKLVIQNSDTVSHVATIPSCFSEGRNGSITTVTVPAKTGGVNGQVTLFIDYDGAQYNIFNDPVPTSGTGTTFALTTSPTFVTPVLGTPTSGDASKMTADGTNAIGFLGIPQNSKSAAYTTVLGDAGKHIFHPAADTTARTWTIDSNANVAYPVGTAISFVNETLGGVITIAITSDTLLHSADATTGNYTLAASKIATAVKITSTKWIISP